MFFFLCLQGGLSARRHTRIVSSPITSTSSQQIRISSSRPKSPKQRFLPWIIRATTWPEHVSTSTSQTCPRRQPSVLLITSLQVKSVTQHFTGNTPWIYLCRCRSAYAYRHTRTDIQKNSRSRDGLSPCKRLLDSLILRISSYN